MNGLMKNNLPFAEVIESSLLGWVAHSWEWDSFPSFGSLVVVDDNLITRFGVVHQVHTGSSDPTRMPFPYQKTEQELRREQPQIFTFLKTTFTCLSVGYQEKGSVLYLLPPTPPKMHSFVRSASSEEQAVFFETALYLPMLFNLQNELFNLDELLLAIIKEQCEQPFFAEKRLASFMQTYALLTGNDYRRSKLLLQRVEQMVRV